MSIYDFYPMKKRRICRTPNGGRQSSTLGKLKNGTNEIENTAVDAGIEVLWDNNSPSPTTTLALGKRQRKRQKYNNMDEHNDISFVVQKLSENTSPVVDNTRSALLDMWVNKEQSGINDDEDFTSPNEIQRECKRATKRSTRKTTSKQFMLEIRKLVDEIQKNDEGSSTQGNRNSQNKTKEQSLLREEGNKVQVSTDFNDSFEWTEDDMDDLILTCQLSSSGKGSINDPTPPKHPQCGLSPSTNVIPETQVLFSGIDIDREQQVLPEQIPPKSHASEHAKQFSKTPVAKQPSVCNATVATQRTVAKQRDNVAKQQCVTKQRDVVARQREAVTQQRELAAKQQCVTKQREVVTKQRNVAMQPVVTEQHSNGKQSIVTNQNGNQGTNKLVTNGTTRVPCTNQRDNKRTGGCFVDTSWNDIFDEDDSLLECAAQEFELSQKTSQDVVNKQIRTKNLTENILHREEKNFTKVCERSTVQPQLRNKQPHSKYNNNHHVLSSVSQRNNISMDCDIVRQSKPSSVRRALSKTHHSKDRAMKTDEIMHCNDMIMACNETSTNQGGQDLSTQKYNRQEPTTTVKKLNNKSCVVEKMLENNEFMLDDLDDLLQDFNFEDLHVNANNENTMTSTQLPSKKTSYSEQEIEEKRKAAQRRRLAKTHNTRRR